MERTVRWRIVANAFSMTFVVPSIGPTSSFLPSGVPRMMTRDHACSSARALAPAHALFGPEQRHLCFFELAGGGALEVEDRDRHLETLRPARVRQREADALGTFADTVAHPPATNSDRTDAGHDLTLRQVAVAHQTSAAIVDYLVGVSLEQSRYLGFDRPPEQPR